MAKIPENVGQTQFTDAPSSQLYAKAAPVDYSGLNKGLDKLADSVYAVVEARKEAQDSTAVLDAYAKASKDKNIYLYDPDQGIYSRKGADALAAGKNWDADVKKMGESHSANLTPDGKKKFDTMWQRSNVADYEGLLKFQLGESQNYKKTTSDSLVDNAVTAAIQRPRDIEILNRSKTEILGAVINATKGASDEVRADALRTAYSTMHKGIIQRLAADSPTEAQKYFEANKEEVTGADTVHVTNFLKEAIFKGSVLKDAERITATAGTPVRKLYDTMTANNPKKGALVKAVTKQESDFRPTVKAYNKDRYGNIDPEKTASGLMQVLVGTAREISREMGDGIITKEMKPEHIAELLEDEDLNVRYGTYYLDKQLVRYGGDLEAGLIAYNAGPANADKFLRSGRDYGVLPDRKQTEPYVRNVMAMFARNLEGSGLPNTQRSLAQANVTPAATEAEIKRFRSETKVGTNTVAQPVVDSAAQMYDAVPDAISSMMSWWASGSDILVKPETAFAKEWVMDQAETFGVVANDEEGAVRLSAPAKTDTVSPLMMPEYDLNQWIAETDKITDPVRREAVLKEILQRHSALERAKVQDDNEAKRQAWSLALDGKEIPLDLKKQLTPEYLSSIESYQKKQNSSEKIRTDWAVWNSLRMMTKDELKAVPDAMAYRNQLSDKEFSMFVNMIRDARGVTVDPNQQLTGSVRTRTQIVKDTVGKAFKNNPEALGKLNSELDEDIIVYQKVHKKEPDAKTIQEMTDRLVIRAAKVSPGWISKHENIQLFQLQPGDFLSRPVVDKEKDIPIGPRVTMETGFSKNFGRRPTEVEKTYIWSAALAYQRGAYIDIPDSIKMALVKQGYSLDRVNSAFGALSAQWSGIE